MRTSLYISLVVIVLFGCSCRAVPVIANPSSTQIPAGSEESRIKAVFSDLRALNPMRPDEFYTVGVAGTIETGPKEQFLRRRTDFRPFLLMERKFLPGHWKTISRATLS